MDVRELNKILDEIRWKNNWKIELKLHKIWTVSIYDADTDELLAFTGSTSLSALPVLLSIPLDNDMWAKSTINIGDKDGK